MIGTPEEHDRYVEKIVFAEAMKDATAAVFQEKPICPHCLEVVNIMDPKVKVNYIEVKIGERTYRLAEPICPCGELVQARYHIVN